jgi:hypothetical protein
MRMRKLGHGQSVMFFAPLEVDRGIRESAGKTTSDQVSVLDILRWAMLETCKDIEHHVPHWAQQGVDYDSRQRAWKEFSSSPHSSVEGIKSSWLRPEARTMEAMYGLPSPADAGSPSHYAAFDIPEIRDRCQMFGALSLSDTRMEEEQEREVHHEVERERQVERPPKARAATHQVHEHVRQLVVSGQFAPNSPAFVSVFLPLARFAAASQDAWSPYLLATKEFSTTIQGPIDTADDYLRPVNWIISCARQSGTFFVVLSPYEVDNLLPEIRRSKAVHLHQYTPKVTQSMKAFDDLTFYCLPPLPPSWVAPTMEVKNQLNLWAGQLYLPDRRTYLQLCNFLGLYTTEILPEDDISIQSDGFIEPEHRRGFLLQSPFTESPVPFLKELIGLRRKGMSYLSTPLGKILHAKLLTEEDFYH